MTNEKYAMLGQCDHVRKAGRYLLYHTGDERIVGVIMIDQRGGLHVYRPTKRNLTTGAFKVRLSKGQDLCLEEL